MSHKFSPKQAEWEVSISVEVEVEVEGGGDTYQGLCASEIVFKLRDGT